MSQAPNYPLPPPIRSRDVRPLVTVTRSRIALAAGDTWRRLASANCPPVLFRTGTSLARIDAYGDEARLRVLGSRELKYHLTRVVRFAIRDRDKLTGKGRPCDVPEEVLSDMLAEPAPPLPGLTRITRAPFYAPDGRLVLTPGYDAASETYFHAPVGYATPTVATYPSDDEVFWARDVIARELLCDFPFVTAADLAHAMGLLILPFARDLIRGPTPLHLIDKPSPGTGATLLAQVLLVPSCGVVPIVTETVTEDEWRKRLTAILLEARPAVLIDNVQRQLNSSALAGVLTSTEYSDRILSKTETVRVPVKSVFVATGNNVRLKEDYARRSVWIRIVAPTERPWERTHWRHALPTWATQNRWLLATAALTLIQRWLAIGRLRPEGLITLGSYEEWSHVIGGILWAAGVPGFLENRAALLEHADLEAAATTQLLETWWSAFQGKDVGVANLMPHALLVDGLGLDADSPRGAQTQLGNLLARLKDRVVGRFRVNRVGSKQRACVYRLELVNPGTGSAGVHA
jgi:hypothetical protein